MAQAHLTPASLLPFNHAAAGQYVFVRQSPIIDHCHTSSQATNYSLQQ